MCIRDSAVGFDEFESAAFRVYLPQGASSSGAVCSRWRSCLGPLASEGDLRIGIDTSGVFLRVGRVRRFSAESGDHGAALADVSCLCGSEWRSRRGVPLFHYGEEGNVGTISGRTGPAECRA